MSGDLDVELKRGSCSKGRVSDFGKKAKEGTHECGNADSYSNHIHIRQTPRLFRQCLQPLLRRKIDFRGTSLLCLELVVSLRGTQRCGRVLSYGRSLEERLGRGQAGDDVKGV